MPIDLNGRYDAIARICVSVGATWKTPVTLRFGFLRSGTILASTGAATRVNTTGMSVMCLARSTASKGPTTPSVTEVPQV